MGGETVFEDLNGVPETIGIAIEGGQEDEFGEKPISFASDDDLNVTVVEEEEALPADDDGASEDLPADVVAKVTLEFDPGAINSGPSSAVLALQKENVELKRGNAEEATKRYQADYDSAKSELREAIETGDTDKQVDINDRMIDLKAKTVQSQIESESFVDPVDTGNPALEAWMGKNPWYSDSKNSAHQDVVHRIDKEMVNSGKDPRDPAYFVELNRRLSEALPDLFTGGAQKQEVREQKPRRSGPPVAPQRAAASSGRRGSNQVVLTRADLRSMEEFGLDPNNRDHIKAFARERQASNQREALA